MRSAEFGGAALLKRAGALVGSLEQLPQNWHRSHLIALAHALWLGLSDLHRTGDHNWPRSDPTLDPVEGDILPPIGARVLIHLASRDEWVEHTVVGYYVWPPLKPNASLRVFVRVRDEAGYLNSRLLHELRPL